MTRRSAVIVGFGYGGRGIHLPLLRDAGADVTVVARSADAQERARDLGATVVGSIDELAGRTAEVVVITVPDDAHEEQFGRSLGLSPRAIVVDKPIATTSAAATRMIEAARSAGAVLVPFQNRRWDGDFLTLKRLAAEGELGQLIRVTSRISGWAPLRPTWRAERRTGIDGRLADIGSHLADQLVELLGPVERVYAEIRTVRASDTSNDDCFLALGHRSGATSHLHMSAVASAPAPRFSAQGDLGTYQIDGDDPQMHQLFDGMLPGAAGWGEEPGRAGVVAAAETREVPTLPGDWREFYRILEAHLDGAGAPPVDAGDAVHVLRVLEAALESAATRSVVAVA